MSDIMSVLGEQVSRSSEIQKSGVRLSWFLFMLFVCLSMPV